MLFWVQLVDVEDEIARGSPFLFAKCVSSSFILFFFFFFFFSLNNLSVPHPKWIIGSLRSLLVGHSLFYNSIMVHIINGRSVARSGLRAMIRRNRYLSRSLKCRYICFCIVRQSIVRIFIFTNISPSVNIIWYSL